MYVILTKKIHLKSLKVVYISKYIGDSVSLMSYQTTFEDF